MAQQRGSTTKILVVTAETFKQDKQALSGEAHILPYVSESLRQSRNLLTSKTIRSSRNAQKPVRGNVEVAGDVNFELAPQYGKLLRHIFGNYTAVSGAGFSTHTYKVGDLPAGGLNIEKQFTDLATSQYFKYVGCKINSFKFSVKSEGFIDCSVNVMGAKEYVKPGSMDGNPVDLGHTPFDGFGCTITEGGLALAVATTLDFTLENGLDGNTYVIDGTGERYSMPDGTVKVSGSINALFDSMTMYNKALNNTETAIVITLTNGTGVGTAGNEKLVLTLPEIIFKPQAPVVSGPTGVLVELPFEAYYNDDVNATTLMAVLTSPTGYYG
jgi:hypothetical protein